MKYVSSRNKNEIVESHNAIIQGLAKDGGLFTPENINIHINVDKLTNLSYQQIATKVIHAFLDDFTEEEISSSVNQAYDNKFDTEEIVPLHKIEDAYLMELYHGPTSAFKDIALTLLPHLLIQSYNKENRHDTISILTATSGDTGKAALSGFADVKHTAITVFYPEVGVSQVQKKQMQTAIGDNVEVIAVKGNFDDCQRMVKEATQDPQVLASLHNVTISSANSINVGRLIPQVVYYYSSYCKLVKDGAIQCGDPVNFVVPTGNFGDILAGYLAYRTGLPVNLLICASNSNNVLTDFLNTGTYSIHRPFIPTMSPSMDILISSNLERLLFIMSDNDDSFVANMMKELNEQGSYTIPSNIQEKISSIFKGYWTSEEDCAKTIHDLYKKEHVLIDPHTAVGLHAYRQYQLQTQDKTPSIVLSTASPYKFCKDVYQAVSSNCIEDDFEAMDALHTYTQTAIPSNLACLKDLPVRFTRSIEKEDGMKVIAERMKEIGNDHN